MGKENRKKSKIHRLRRRQFNRPAKGEKIIIMIISKCTKQVMHNAIAHHLLTDAQPVPQQRLPSWPASPRFIRWVWHHMVRNILFASLGQLCWLCPLPISHALPTFSLAGQHEKMKSPWLLRTKTSVCYQHYSHPKSKTQHYASY